MSLTQRLRKKMGRLSIGEQSDEVQEALNRIKGTKEHTKNLSKIAKHLVGALQTYGIEGMSLVDELKAYGEGYDADLGKDMIEISEAFKEVYFLTDDLQKSMNGDVKAPFDEYMEGDMKTAREIKQGYEASGFKRQQAKEKFEKAQQAHSQKPSSKTESKMAEAQSVLAPLQRDHEQLSADVTGQFNAILESRDKALRQQLIALVGSHLTSAKRTYDTMKELEPLFYRLKGEEPPAPAADNRDAVIDQQKETLVKQKEQIDTLLERCHKLQDQVKEIAEAKGMTVKKVPAGMAAGAALGAAAAPKAPAPPPPAPAGDLLAGATMDDFFNPAQADADRKAEAGEPSAEEMAAKTQAANDIASLEVEIQDKAAVETLKKLEMRKAAAATHGDDETVKRTDDQITRLQELKANLSTAEPGQGQVQAVVDITMFSNTLNLEAR